ncbi:MAG: Ldh family oxidoreductase [Gammaproteobacteria bacterium]|nr:Ldh family oxidoreductase [Gammaproteobacteria bacterium]NIR83585.1 Ldh family oxidoreductase [Gammaproteobacteria bacterium]NIR91507.1 Ldh family oxidoreductase [Gammaproteobacteria bacterium]NIU04747.1 Ldh family oxidoreductase [Gammaproteobacteria bacterium]NIV51789.1 Ldh family oxidoreductase [Gammaproteobacteria bacterium]
MTLDQVHATARDICIAHGYSRDHATAIADTVTAAERDECKSHGLFRIPFYIRALREAPVSPDAVPSVQELAPGVVQVDAHFGFAPLALQAGADALTERARRQGIAALCVVNAYNVAALWPEVERQAERGLVAFAFTAAMSYVAPAGGTRPLYGTNPMAFAWPREGKPPMVFDQASSASARGEIQLHLRAGKPIPEGWAVGPDGEPTTDPTVALEGAQLPFGGYKGAAIALMVELLAGALVGDVFSFEASERDGAKTGAPCGGEFMIAIDPGRCVGDGDRSAQLAHAERLFSRILEQEGTRLPGDRRYAARRRTISEGVTVPRALYDELQSLKRT